MAFIKTFSMKWNVKGYALGILVAGLTAAVFLPVLQGEFLHWDDHNLYVENVYYRGWSPANLQWMCSTFLLGHWQPLSWMSCALDYTLWGMNPAGWHLTNLLLHMVNAVLVYFLCLALLKEKAGLRGAALMAALFWGIHPLRVEAVAWLATRGYLLCTTFCLLTLLFYLQAVAQKRYPLAALLFFALATVTKGIGMMLPAVLLLIDGFSLRRMSSWRTAAFCAFEKIPFFALSLLTGVAAFLAKRAQGGMASIERYGLVDRAGQAIYGIWFYLIKTIAPIRLSAVYSKQPELTAVIAAMVLASITAGLLVLFRKKLFAASFGRCPATARPLSLCSGPIIGTFCAFLVLIFPMLGITQSGVQVVADRFTYLAAIPFSVLLAAGLVRLPALRRTAYGALAALLLIFSVRTWVWADIWSDSLSLWNHSIAVDGEDARAYNGMGQALMDRKAYTKAIEYFDKALSVDPRHLSALQNRAAARIKVGEYQLAVEDTSRALNQPGVTSEEQVKMHIGRGLAAEALGNTQQALEDYSAVINNPESDSVWRMRALQGRAKLYLQQGLIKEGERDLQAVLNLPDPSGDYWRRARVVLDEIKKIPEE